MSKQTIEALNCPHCGQLEQPSGWGNDGITTFLDHARRNSYVTFDKLKGGYRRLSDIDKAFRAAKDSLHKPNPVVPALFLLQTHSSFLASMSLSLSCQLSEAYALLRLTLENAIYGFYLYKNPKSKETWFNRHDDDEEAKKKVRAEFKIVTLEKELTASDNLTGNVFKTLYDRTIDFGAHPNPLSLLQRLTAEKNGSKVQLDLNYLTENTEAFQGLLKTTAQVGVCSLDIFGLAYRERFAIAGLPGILNELRQGL